MYFQWSKVKHNIVPTQIKVYIYNKNNEAQDLIETWKKGCNVNMNIIVSHVNDFGYISRKVISYYILVKDFFQ